MSKTFYFYAKCDIYIFRFSRSFYSKRNLHTNLVRSSYGKQIDANHCHQIRADPRHQCIISQAVVHRQPFMYRRRYSYSIYNKYKRAAPEENVTHAFCLKTTTLRLYFFSLRFLSSRPAILLTTTPIPHPTPFPISLATNYHTRQHAYWELVAVNQYQIPIPIILIIIMNNGK